MVVSALVLLSSSSSDGGESLSASVLSYHPAAEVWMSPS